MIRVTCACEASFDAKPELAGKRVRCPACNEPVLVPNPAERLRVRCPCGRTVKAKPELVGKRVKCPACGQPLLISQQTEPAPQAGAPAPGGAVDLLSEADDLFGDPPAPADNETKLAPLPPQPAPVEKPRSTRKESRQYSQQEVLILITGVVCVVHGLARLGSIYALRYLLTSSALFSFTGLISVASILASIGIGAAGIGLLTQKEWAGQLGAAAAGIYFSILAFALLQALALSLGSNGAGLGHLFRAIPRIAAESVAPGLLLYINQQ